MIHEHVEEFPADIRIMAFNEHIKKQSGVLEYSDGTFTVYHYVDGNKIAVRTFKTTDIPQVEQRLPSGKSYVITLKGTEKQTGEVIGLSNLESATKERLHDLFLSTVGVKTGSIAQKIQNHSLTHPRRAYPLNTVSQNGANTCSRVEKKQPLNVFPSFSEDTKKPASSILQTPVSSKSKADHAKPATNKLQKRASETDLTTALSKMSPRNTKQKRVSGVEPTSALSQNSMKDNSTKKANASTPKTSKLKAGQTPTSRIKSQVGISATQPTPILILESPKENCTMEMSASTSETSKPKADQTQTPRIKLQRRSSEAQPTVLILGSPKENRQKRVSETKPSDKLDKCLKNECSTPELSRLKPDQTKSTEIKSLKRISEPALTLKLSQRSPDNYGSRESDPVLWNASQLSFLPATPDDPSHISLWPASPTKAVLDDSDICLIQESVKHVKTYKYKPVDRSWRETCCERLGITEMMVDFAADHYEPYAITDGSEVFYRLDDVPKHVEYVEPDGNCLFSSLSHVFTGGSPDAHLTIREMICSFMETHKEVFLQISGRPRESFDKYLENMREDGEWGSSLELFACATMIGTPISTFLDEQWTSYLPRNIAKERTRGPVNQSIDNYNEVIYLANRTEHYYPVLSISKKAMHQLNEVEHSDWDFFTSRQISPPTLGMVLRDFDEGNLQRNEDFSYKMNLEDFNDTIFTSPNNQ
ncbi:OTU-like cysteine protease domain-containing protein [Ditylenchus destructor]|nr:OTU-like cysteine protease domain-containing protein [Ditylenchus destructor]